VPLRHLPFSSRQPGDGAAHEACVSFGQDGSLIRNYKDVYSRKMVLITTLEPTKITSAPKARGATNEGPPVCFK
jgi:hypothetical protein